MMYRFKPGDDLGKRSVVFPIVEATSHIPIEGSLASNGSGAFRKTIAFIFDPGANGALVVGRRLLNDLEIQYENLGDDVSTGFDGAQSRNQMTQLSLNIKTDRGHVSFTNVPAVVVNDAELKEAIDPIIGLQILYWFNYKIAESRFEFFVPNDLALASLEEWEADLSKGGSVIKPIEPISEKVPEIKLPEIPPLPKQASQPEQASQPIQPHWREPSSLAPRAPKMPKMPDPPSPGKVPKP